MPQATLSPSLLQQLEGLTVRHTTITKELENPDIAVASLTSLSKEAAELSPVVEALRSFKDVQAAMASANAVCEDPQEEAGVYGVCCLTTQHPCTHTYTHARSTTSTTVTTHPPTDVKSLAREELSDLRQQLFTLEGQLLRALLPKDVSDTRDVVLEVCVYTVCHAHI